MADSSVPAACELAKWSQCAQGIDVAGDAADGSITVDTVAHSSMSTDCAGMPGVYLRVTVGVVVKIETRACDACRPCSRGHAGMMRHA